ncbi:hypothetical protein HLB23_32720 [Nocardia uniformis]|uniref:Uncharacterized protein n=1 Tax=Nocardia uniformis TaxID=53432 RepID=A0A849CDK8_9NOCA|nr:hypothetical protein [Nocardia uniformis]NNH74560.1 hypothetical protein [Nocardia uniformis]
MTEKLSITMPDRVAAAARAAAAAAGKPLSTWIAETIDRVTYADARRNDVALIEQQKILGEDWAVGQAAAFKAARPGVCG